MARIRARKGIKRTTCSATVRIKGQPTITRSFDTKGEATAWAADVEREIRSGRYQDYRKAESITLDAALRKYLNQVSITKRPNSEKRDQQSARMIIRLLGKNILLSDVTPKVLAEYRDTRLRDVKPSTIQKELALLSHMFNVANREWGVPVENSVSKILKPKVKNSRTQFLTHDELNKLLIASKSSKNAYLFPYLLILAHTGMRPGEAAGLKWRDVDIDGRIIKLHITKTESRFVPLTNMAENELRSIKPDNVENDMYVFIPKERSISKTIVENPSRFFVRAFDNARKRAGLEDIKLHDLRHTAASHLLMSGVDLRTLAEILGHKTMQMVYRYTHLLNDHKIKAINMINTLGVEK